MLQMLQYTHFCKCSTVNRSTVYMLVCPSHFSFKMASASLLATLRLLLQSWPGQLINSRSHCCWDRESGQGESLSVNFP